MKVGDKIKQFSPNNKAFIGLPIRDLLDGLFYRKQCFSLSSNRLHPGQTENSPCSLGDITAQTGCVPLLTITMSPLPKLLLLLGAQVTGTTVWREQMRRHDLSHTEASKPTAAAWTPLEGFKCPDLSNRPACNLPPGCIRLHAEHHGPSFTGKLGKFILFCWKIFTKTNEMFLRDEEIANF